MVHARRIVWFMAFIVTVFSFWGTAYTQQHEPDVRYVPTPDEVITEMLKIAKVTQDDVVYDLGCGDGRTVIAAAKMFGARGVGVDIDPVRIRESNENARKAEVADRVKFLEQDLFKTDIREATVVFLYLLPDLNLQLRPKLFRDLKPGTRIVSHEFHMYDWKPDYAGVVPQVKIYYSSKYPDVKDTHFYYWVIPANVAGVWRWSLPPTSGHRDFTLRLAQKFQEISGGVNVKAKEVRITDARLVGDQVSFTIRNDTDKDDSVMRFNGRVSGNGISGTVEVQGGPSSENYTWTARRNP